MIPEIGIVVGLYVVTRMLEILVRTEPKASAAVAIPAILTLVVAVLVIVDLAVRGATGLNLNDLRPTHERLLNSPARVDVRRRHRRV